MKIKSDESRLKIAVLILNQENTSSEQRIHAYRIIDSITCTNNRNYEKNINFLYGIDKQIAQNTIINRSVAIDTIF